VSHVTAFPGLVITDLQTLREVAASLGLEMVEATTYRWYGRWMNDWHTDEAAYKLGIKPEEYGHCNGGYKLVIPGDTTGYEIGVHKHPEGAGYCLVYDLYGHKGKALQAKIGEKGERLKQNYTLALAQKKMAQKGFRVVGTTKLANGSVQLKMQRGV
jgi:hypothetical protein